jgi:hypothetical protein
VKRRNRSREYKYGYPSTDKYRMNEEVGREEKSIERKKRRRTEEEKSIV